MVNVAAQPAAPQPNNRPSGLGRVRILGRILASCMRIVLMLLRIVIVAVVVFLASFLNESCRLFWLEQGLFLVQSQQSVVVVDNARWPALNELQLGYVLVVQNNKPLVELSDVQLGISLAELLQRRLHVTRLYAAGVVLYQPAPKTPPAPAAAMDRLPTFDLTRLPAVKIASLEIDKLLLRNFRWPTRKGEQLPGPKALQIAGSAALNWPDPLQLELTVNELSGEGNGQATPLIWLQGVSDTALSLTLTGGVQQAAGGWLSQWLSLPAKQVLELDLSLKAEQTTDGITVRLNQLRAPVLQQAIELKGQLRYLPTAQRLDLEKVQLSVNQQQHKLSGSISAAQIQMALDVQRFDLALLAPWVADLDGGFITAQGDLVWDWRPKTLPTGSASLKGEVFYKRHEIKLNSQLELSPYEVSIRQFRANLGETQLSVKGRLRSDNKPMALTYTLTHLRDGPLRDILPPALQQQIPAGLSVHAQRIGGLLRGTIRDPHIIADVNILGSYEKTPFIIFGMASVSKTQADVQQLHLEVADATLDVTGLVDWVSDKNNLRGSIHHLSPNLIYQFVPRFPPGLVGYLNADLEFSGALNKPALLVDALFQGGFEHQSEVLPFNLAIDAKAQLGTFQDIALDVRQLKLAVFSRPLITVKGRVNKLDNDFRVVVSRLPTQLLEALGYQFDAGRAEARLHFSGSFANPELAGYLSYAEMLSVRNSSDERTEVPLIWHANLSSELEDLKIDSSFTLDKASAGEINLSVPWHNYLDYALNKAGGDLMTAGQLKAKFDTSALQLFMDTDQITLRGEIEADLTLGGTAQTPTLAGEMLFKDGYLRLASTGTVLDNIQLYAQAEGQRLKLMTALARDGEGGTLKADGHIDWRDPNSPSAFDLGLYLKNANLIDTPNVKGAVSGDLDFTGGLKGFDLAGKLELQPLGINIDSAPAVAIAQLSVQEVFNNDNQTLRKKATQIPIALSIEIKIDNQAFIRGRGLTTELVGNIAVTGDASDPKVAGNFKTRRGEIQLLQKPIVLNEGRAQFSNDAFNFVIPATYSTGDIVINIVVSGDEDEVKLELSSIPSLPQEEILSRLLFGNSVQNISALEALSLASAINTISNGSSFNPLDITREKLGFDTLSVGQDSEDNGGGVNVGVGKYLNERVYLELERSSNPVQPWQGNLTIDLTKELHLNSTAAGSGKSSAALEWRRDY